ncbi:MAG: Clp protease N-terminal domain-containing protein [Candidatus Tectimicrobiota bacterium]
MPNLSHGVYIAWELAAREAARARHQYIDREFLLIGLCSLEKWLAAQQAADGQGLVSATALADEAEALAGVLRTCAITPTRLRQTLRAALGTGTWTYTTNMVVHRSAACKATFQRALALAEASGAAEGSCLHMLRAVLEQPGGLILGVVTALRADLDALRYAVAAATVSSTCQVTMIEAVAETPAPPVQQPLAIQQPPVIQHPPAIQQPSPSQPSASYLKRYGHDITQEARDGKLEPVVGRKNEILSLVRTLGRRSKNIPVLISEPGVSRIAVVKGLALRIARGGVVETIRDKRLVELHMPMLSGIISLHGELEQALPQVLEEAGRDPQVILFLDDIHAIVGVGCLAEKLASAALLKTTLLGGTIRCIGATTVENYQRYIASDPQLERLCQPILVNEPTPEEMQEILEQVRVRYEQHHRVTITPEAIETVVTLAARHLPDKRFPEKALDILDQACSRARIVQLTQLEPDDGPVLEREVTRLTIAEVLAEKTGISAALLLESEREKLQRRIQALKSQVTAN